MTERERLLDLLSYFGDGYAIENRRTCETRIVDIADYLLANGVIVPPCKVGDTVYMPWEWSGVQGIACLKVTTMSNILGFGWSCGTDLNSDDDGFLDEYNYGRLKFDDVGKTVFLTKEEAEKALKERSNNETDRTD